MRTIAIALVIGLISAGALLGAEPTPWKVNVIPPGYRVETISTPAGVYFGVAGLDVAPNGDVFAATRFGDVWRYRAGEWTRFAEGLNEPCGLLVDGRSGRLLVMQKPELTRVIDTDEDGHADEFQTVSDAWGFSGNYHEFAFGPVRDSHGNLYGTLNLSHGGGKSVKGSTMSTAARWRGTCVKITPEGETSVHSWGLRSPAGIGIYPRSDDVFYTDNQGDWNASSTLHHVVEGRFHGHPASLIDHPDFTGRNLNQIPDEEYRKLWTPPAAWIPHGEIANSPGNPVADYNDGRFGPFHGQLFVGDQTRSNIFRVALEKVGGEYQGCVINFIDHLQCGAIRIAFAPDASMWVGQTSRGWGSVGGAPFGVQRIVYDGTTIPFEIHSVSLTRDGFDVRFTKPVDRADAGSADRYPIQHWTYRYHAAYGSDKIDTTSVKPTGVTVSDDGLTVSLKLAELMTERVYMIPVNNVKSAAGESLTSNRAYYTLNRLRE